MILTNIALAGTAWTISDKGGVKLSGNIDLNQVLNVTVQGTAPYTVNFNTSTGSRTATLTGVSSPDACAVYWLNTDSKKGIEQEAAITYPWA
jgi:hypothetical protein